MQLAAFHSELESVQINVTTLRVTKMELRACDTYRK